MNRISCLIIETDQEAIRQIESGSEPPLPSGEELASEIERFLRGQP